MLSKPSLGLAEAKALIAAAEVHAAQLDVNVSVAVVDATTYPQASVRMDGAPPFSAQGALDKARSAASRSPRRRASSASTEAGPEGFPRVSGAPLMA